jgi:hypothetical protein
MVRPGGLTEGLAPRLEMGAGPFFLESGLTAGSRTRREHGWVGETGVDLVRKYCARMARGRISTAGYTV